MLTGRPMPDAVDTIVVPLDGSSASERAARVASTLAERLGAAVETVHPGGGRAAEEIHQTVEKLQPAIVCMASHGRGRSAGVVASVAAELVARYHHPVVMVGPMVDTEDGAGVWGVAACVDERPVAELLVALAVRWAERLEAPLTVMTVAEPVPEPLITTTAHRLIGPDGDVAAYLDRLVEPHRNGGVPIDTAVSWDPVSPAAGVVDYLEAHRAGLVMVMSHGRTGFKRLALGSVAANIVHRSPAPVLVVPAAP